MKEPAITLETATNLGLSQEEFERIQQVMGRMPNFTELSAFSVMWSENCSKKNSLFWLRSLPREAPAPLLPVAGEEHAAFADLGDGMACVFKIVSHNHPSASEPYQGAATGVGRVHLDIFARGARPIAALHSLHLGDMESAHTRRLLRGAISGIGDYSKALEVPMVDGELFFHQAFHHHILVNILSVGLLKAGEAIPAKADGPGNPVFIVGSPDSREGTSGGAVASSNDPGEASSVKRPADSGGDPFLEKLLLEATQEAIPTGAITGMQGLSAAGIAGTAAEMSARSRTGMRIDLDKAPNQPPLMPVWETLLAKTPERLLIVGRRGTEQSLRQVFEKWNLGCEQIGQVTDTGRLAFYRHGQLVADLPVRELVAGEGAPVYQREYSKPGYLQKIQKFNPSSVPPPPDYRDAARKMVESPNIASRGWIYEQYHSMSSHFPADAVLLPLNGTNKALALALHGNSAYVYADPHVGAMIAVAMAARHIVCSGGVPLALTYSLNFGNPYNQEVYWQFVHAVKGLAEACRKFGFPVTGGPVSFYNQSVFKDRSEPCPPTPLIGMVGLVKDLEHRMPLGFQSIGDHIYMIGTPNNDLGSSEYLRLIHGINHSPAPRFDLEEELHIQQNIRNMIREGYLESVHDISQGGLFVALLECALVKQLGFTVETDSNFRRDAYLFGEGQCRIIVTVTTAREDEFVNYLNSHNVSFSKLGEVAGDRLLIDEEDFGPVEEWKSRYDRLFQEKMNS